MNGKFALDGFFVANFVLAIINLAVLAGCFPKCHRRYRWVFISAVLPMLYLIGLYTWELVTWTLTPAPFQRVVTTMNLFLLTSFMLLTRHGNGYGKH